MRSLIRPSKAPFLAVVTLLVTAALESSSTAHAQANAVKPRMVIAFDTSGSMLFNAEGLPTFGDGSGGVYSGVDTNCDGLPNDSRLFIAKEVLRSTLHAYGDMEYALVRFPQSHLNPNIPDYSLPAICTANVFGECQLPAEPYLRGTSYGDPNLWTGDACEPAAANFGRAMGYPTGPGCWVPNIKNFRLPPGANDPFIDIPVCLNYRGLCWDPLDFASKPADVLVGWPNVGAYANRDNLDAILKWIDNRESVSIGDRAATTDGDYCNHRSSGDCELRGHGATPLAGILQGSLNYIANTKADDPRAACRPYSVILLTDGNEQCMGNPAAIAGVLASLGVKVYVIGISIEPADRSSLNAIAQNGGTDAGGVGGDYAYFASDRVTLAAALSEVVRRSLLIEVCNNVDDNCNDLIDEGFTKYCDRANGITALTQCVKPLETICDSEDDNCDGVVDEGVKNSCGVCGAAPAEVCDLLDNDCNGVIDDGNVCSGCVPTAEICDNIDNDCNGLRDDNVTRSCGSDVGLCEAGTQICTANVWGACSDTRPAVETCDNEDNDCDGLIDGFTESCGEVRGQCRPGQRLCTRGVWGSCVGGVLPRDEVCDGFDNNCDGVTDEGNPGGGALCGTDVPPCSKGRRMCVDGALECVGGRQPQTETCNDIDDNCDGTKDNGVPPGAACGIDEGECEFGREQCIAGGYVCMGGQGPQDELCDGLDNNCDGERDEGNPQGGLLCGDDTGLCEFGLTRCVSAELTCEGGTGSTAEICNGEDDDCNGAIDDGLGIGEACGSTIGECRPGVQFCTPEGVRCVGERGPQTELCNGLDDDCDGDTDEGIPAGDICGTSVGVCRVGNEQCIRGRPLCADAVLPTTEQCDCIDNDCDGSVDEEPANGSLCPTGAGCVQCQCAARCRIDEFGPVCPIGKNVLQRDGECFCVATLCDARECAEETRENAGATTCAPDLDNVAPCACRGAACTWGCSNVTCPADTTCDPRDPAGTCVESNCRGLGCVGAKECNARTGECVDRACAAGTCEADQVCRNGLCEASCGNTTCAAGERCVHGACVVDRCAGVTCDRSSLCNPESGACISNQCAGIGCPSGRTCLPWSGRCVDDLCKGVRCPSGQSCVSGECGNYPSFDGGVSPYLPGVRVTTTGGGGCSVTTSSPRRNNGLVLLFGLALVGLALSVRSRRPIALLALVSLGACDIDAYCLTCTSEDGSVTNSDVRRPRNDVMFVREDAISVDVPCSPTSAETCNGVDDDCDLEVDEGVDTSSDVNHCGACFSPCTLAHAFPTCSGGVCGFSACDVGFLDLDGEPTNGCEYACLKTADDDTLCDRIDNDCDGVRDEDVDTAMDAMNCGGCGVRCVFPRATSACETGMCRISVCEAGFFDEDGRAENGCEYACVPASPAVEQCNGRDDDCDGDIDEENPGAGAACGVDEGLCTRGVEQCRGGRIVCEGGIQPATESCDGEDNDCDGQTDEAVATVGNTCGTDVGECRLGRVACTDGRLICQNGFESRPEMCNLADDDCDGQVDEGNPGGGAVCGDETGECAAGHFECRGGGLQCVDTRGPTVERCNLLDDDCDGTPDNDFDLTIDPRNCGACGRACTFTNATGVCETSNCRMICLPGFVDLVNGTTDGCEYACERAGDEVCNGRDDDCDGMIDEGLTPPPNLCNPNGVCAGVVATCSAAGWSCVYGPTYQEIESRCDRVDNDCDGSVDEGFPDHGGVCSVGRGACARTGVLECASSGDRLVCTALTPGSPSSELCDNVDNDCDGLVDEPQDLIDLASVRVSRVGGGMMDVMTYEASRPDATNVVTGSASHIACSRANVQPWTNVTWGEANAACCALNGPSGCTGPSGWHLCDSANWQSICSAAGTCNWAYPSSCSSPQPLICNGREIDSSSTDAGDQDAVATTGAFPMCYVNAGIGRVYDLAGNVKEWTSTSPQSGVYEIRGGAYNNVEDGRRCSFDFTVAEQGFAFPNTGFRCCRY